MNHFCTPNRLNAQTIRQRISGNKNGRRESADYSKARVNDSFGIRRNADATNDVHRDMSGGVATEGSQEFAMLAQSHT